MKQNVVFYLGLLLILLSYSVEAQQKNPLSENILPAGQCEHFPYTNKIYLFQNFPNPLQSNQVTIIRYQAVDALSVSLYIYNADGLCVKKFSNLQPGIHAVTVEANTLSPGEYKYKLFVNDRLVARKKLQVTPEVFGLAVDNFNTY
jgi:hypothetical protein